MDNCSLHRYFEVLYTHPWGEHRKRALFAALDSFYRCTTTNISQGEQCYDPNRADPAYSYVMNRLQSDLL